MNEEMKTGWSVEWSAKTKRHVAFPALIEEQYWAGCSHDCVVRAGESVDFADLPSDVQKEIEAMRDDFGILQTRPALPLNTLFVFKGEVDFVKKPWKEDYEPQWGWDCTNQFAGAAID